MSVDSEHSIRMSPGHVSTGGIVSDIHVIVREVDEVLPQASVTFHVRVFVRLQPLIMTEPSVPLAGDGVTLPQLSVAVAVPRAALITAADGLQPKFELFGPGVPVAVITGRMVSTVQVMVRDAEEVLPQPSAAFHVRVLLRLQPVTITLPSVPLAGDGVTLPQLSEAVAVPRAALIAASVGLQPKFELFGPGFPVGVITGGVKSTTHVMVRDVDAVFPQASVAFHVRVWVRLQPLTTTEPSDPFAGDGVTIPQLSVAVAVPRAALIIAADGLQPKFELFGTGVPVAVITGGVISIVQVIVRDAEEVLPQPSVAFHVRVLLRLQPVTITLPSVPFVGDSVTLPQLSEAVAVPRAALITASVGLQPKFELFGPGFPVGVITGGVKSTIHDMVRDVDAEFPHASVPVNILVRVLLQPDTTTVPSVDVGVTVLQLSVPVAVPKAVLIVADDGLQPRLELFAAGVPVAVTKGAIVSFTVKTCVQEAVLPQASVIVCVLV